jgi:hypothetical protein
MPVRIATEQIFRPTRQELVFYYPKIIKAVGREQDLFPDGTVAHARDAKLNKADLFRYKNEPDQFARLPNHIRWESNANRALHNDIEHAVDELLNPTTIKIRTHTHAQNCLRGFCNWLDRCNYIYDPSAGYEEIAKKVATKSGGDRKVDKHRATVPNSLNDLRLYDYLSEYNLFLMAKSPIGNCLATARAFALLLVLNGFKKEDLALVMIQPMNQDGAIVYKGEENVDTVFCHPSPEGILTQVFELTNSADGMIQGRQLTTKERDQPFANHWVVKYCSRIYDPLYRCSYHEPSDAFDSLERVNCGKPQAFPTPEACPWTFESLMRETEGKQKYFVNFSSEKINNALKIRPANRIRYMVYPTERGETLMGQSLIPLTLGRVFGYCVPEDGLHMRLLLMKAVIAYERGCTGFFRSASNASIDFCRKARKFCEEEETVPDSRIYRSMTPKDWNACRRWDEQAAREHIYNAMYGAQEAVGTTLRKCLWEAFGVPSFFRS